jgi:hypothetical protein
MTFCAVPLCALHLTGLRVLCAIGSFAGFAVILLGLWLDRNARGSSKESCQESNEANPAQESASAESSLRQQVIRLSIDPDPTRSSDMTQQQKIAAALTRAGLGTAGWSQPEHSGSTVVEAPSDSATKIDDAEEAVPPAHSSSKRKLILLVGATLAALSLILFFTLR